MSYYWNYVAIGAELAGFSAQSLVFIFNLINVNMNRSYWILKNQMVFSMGDIAASRGSEVILRAAEIYIYEKLQDKNL